MWNFLSSVYVENVCRLRASITNRNVKSAQPVTKNIFRHVLLSFICGFLVLRSNSQILHSTVTKKMTRNVVHTEDYSFESDLNRANEECSYLTYNSSVMNRSATLQMIKDEVNNRRIEEFYKQKEIEMKASREYYENIERESRRRALGNPPLGPLRNPSLGPLRPPWLVPEHRIWLRRPPRSADRSTPPTFGKVYFGDHNNCTSRCIFARLGMVSNLQQEN